MIEMELDANYINESLASINAMAGVRGMRKLDLVEKYNWNYPDEKTSVASLSNKMYNNTLRFSELCRLADIMDFEIVIREKRKPAASFTVKNKSKDDLVKDVCDLDNQSLLQDTIMPMNFDDDPE